MLKCSIFILCAVLYSTSSFAQSANVKIFGIGRMSCAHWQATAASRSEGSVWLWGFWTGLNYFAASEKKPQSVFDTAAVVAEVAKTCSERPSKTLSSAAWETFFSLPRSRIDAPRP